MGDVAAARRDDVPNVTPVSQPTRVVAPINVRDHLGVPLERSVRVAIVGLGGRGTIYSRLIAGDPDGSVVQVAEPRRSLRARIAGELGLEPDRCFDDWRELVAAPRIADAVVVSLQDRFHLEAIQAFAAAGYDILCEKPLAGTEEACAAAVAAADRAGVFLGVCHVLRYTPTTRRIMALVGSGSIGEVVAVHHLEPVGYFHFAHSFVRGAWRRADESGPMLLTKACHDLDWLSHVVGRPAARVASFGSLTEFVASRRPAGASSRCVECAIEPDCPYSALRHYHAGLRPGAEDEYFTRIVAPGYTAEALDEALRSGPYGRCVWSCDNDVADHQVVSVEYAGGATASFTVSAFTPMEHRRTTITGTSGQLTTDGSTVERYDFTTRAVERFDEQGEGGHGGGDVAMTAAFVSALHDGAPERFTSQGAESLETHRIVFAAERARATRTVVELSAPPTDPSVGSAPGRP
jgi:predicted dehydrogenase